MAIRKYQKVERVEVASVAAHSRVSKLMSKLHKRSASELTEEERAKLQEKLDNQ